MLNYDYYHTRGLPSLAITRPGVPTMAYGEQHNAHKHEVKGGDAGLDYPKCVARLFAIATMATREQHETDNHEVHNRDISGGM